ncbi:MAG: hypothetical protein ACYCPQ_06880 [Elusimicrobiota bacterium]
MIAAALALCLAFFQTPSFAQDFSGQSVSRLHDAFVESVDRSQQAALLDDIAQTKPSTPRDLSSLFDLFMRYPQTQTRSAALASLGRITPEDDSLGLLLLDYLRQPDPKGRFFAIRGELSLRDPAALALIQKIAEKKFPYKNASDTPFQAERDAWWTQYEALDALAAWEGAKAVPLIEKKAADAPNVARILAGRFWPKFLPLFLAWTKSKRANLRQEARQALAAPRVPIADLQKTRDTMLAAVLDPGQTPHARHELAIKVGLCSDAAQVAALIKKRDASVDPQTKLYLLAAVFASRSPQALPLLIQDAKTNPDPAARHGAFVELKGIMPPADYRALLIWAAAHDANPLMQSYVKDELSRRPTAAPGKTGP